MKTTFIILGLCIAFFKTGSTASTTPSQINEALEKCITQQNLNKDKVVSTMRENVIPEDDETAKFFDCFSTDLGLFKPNGDTDFEKLLPIVKAMIKQRLGDVEDADSQAQTMASTAIDQCKSIPKSENAGLTAIKTRNCIRGVSLKPKTR